MGKAKIIKSSTVELQSSDVRWHKLEDFKAYIQGIEVGKLGSDQDNKISLISNTLISGVPTPWARPKLFWFAFDYIKEEDQDQNIQTSGLIQFYHMLANEWKGLVALMALYPGRLKFSDPISMDTDNDQLFDITSAFGRMLMGDSDLWTDQEAKKSNREEKPFIQLLKYNNQVIAGTSPFSLVFPGVDYSQLKEADDIMWYRNGKFEDPIPAIKNDRDKVQKLYLFIRNLNDNFSKFEEDINVSRSKEPLNLEGIKKYLIKWTKELEQLDHQLDDFGPSIRYNNLRHPFQVLLSAEQKVYLRNDGTLTFVKPEKAEELKAEMEDLDNFLKKDKTIIGWYDTSDQSNSLSNSAAYYLKVKDLRDKENPYKYFALPLSMTAIKLFNKDIGSWVGDSESKFRLTGNINDRGNLLVELTVNVDGRPQKLNGKEYEIEWADNNSKILMWPNFISDNWDAYYMYSEFPLSLPGIKFVPFYKECKKQNILSVSRTKGDSELEQLVFSNSNEEDHGKVGLEVTSLVKYPAGEVSQDKHKYEVTRSNKPIAGLEIRYEIGGISQIAGYLVVKNPDDKAANMKIPDYTSEPINKEAIVGIDFGSNNSCVYYTIAGGETKAKPIPFKNKRLPLVGVESDAKITAEKDELLFFSNEEAIKGQVKSWLHEHDINYIGSNKNKEIAGGVPVNEKNILVNEMDHEKIITNAGVLHYNMKWLSDEAGLSKKTAYLKALWLSICADLYIEEKARPVDLRWSFPGSMSSFDQGQYRGIYDIDLCGITPMFESDGQRKRLKPEKINGLKKVEEDNSEKNAEITEAEAVCKYALNQDYGLTNNMFLGLDIGGSTSEILLLAKDTETNKPTLLKQGSLRIAAGVFFKAIIKSDKFRRAIYNYHEQQKKIKVENISEILVKGQKAPFYLNSVFDQLADEDFMEFYSYIGKEASFVFSIPAYVTGLLLYYSGKLASKTIREKQLDNIKDIHLFPFGKGGRLFHWLQTFPGTYMANPYLEKCFKTGYGEGADQLKLKYRSDIHVDNKSEVAMGLAVETELEYDKRIRQESDIFAEKNLKYKNNGEEFSFEEDATVLNKYFEDVTRFEFPRKLENFNEFLKIFIEFIGNDTGMVKNIASIKDKAEDLPNLLESFILNDSEYIKARNAVKQTKKFEYRFPMFIAEGLCFLEKVLIPEIFKS